MPETRLTVENPWGWLWWPQTHPLQHRNPDDDDGKVRQYPGEPVNWSAVVAAVTHAVSACADATDVTERYREVSVPVDMSKHDERVAQRWLCGNAGIMPRVQEPHRNDRRCLGDGRHRLWATWDLFDGLVPIMSNTSLYFSIAHPRDLDGIAQGLKGDLRTERRWWLLRAGWTLYAPNRQYVRNLKACAGYL